MTLHLALWVWWPRGHVEEVTGKDPCPEEVCSLNGKQDGPTTRSRQIRSQQWSTLRADATGAEVPLSKEMPWEGSCPLPKGQVQTLSASTVLGANRGGEGRTRSTKPSQWCNSSQSWT